MTVFAGQLVYVLSSLKKTCLYQSLHLLLGSGGLCPCLLWFIYYTNNFYINTTVCFNYAVRANTRSLSVLQAPHSLNGKHELYD